MEFGRECGDLNVTPKIAIDGLHRWMVVWDGMCVWYVCVCVRVGGWAGGEAGERSVSSRGRFGVS